MIRMLQTGGEHTSIFITKLNLKQIFILFTFLLSNAVNAQWLKQSPVPTHLDVRGIGAPTADRVFIATEDDFFDNGGALFESNDGGNTWIQRNLPLGLHDPFNGLFFLDSQNGWVYGNDNYRTTDGGTTWTQLPFLGSTYFMKFYSATFGYTSGNFGRMVSYNGGISWTTSPNDIFSFDFINDLTGLGVSNNTVYRTTNGGVTFTPVYTEDNAKSVVFLSTVSAAGIVNDAFIYSTDGGVSWLSSSSANGRSKLTAVSDNVVLAWGRTGAYPNYDDRIFRSSDGGQTWVDLGEVIPQGVFAITVSDPQTITAADWEGNMFRSSDAGLSWAQTFNSRGLQPSYFSSAVPFFVNSQTGYFGYGAGFVINTTDGGASWNQISSGTGNSLNDAAISPNGNLIVVGNNGTLITSNGTSQWIIHEFFTTNDLMGVHVINSNDVVVVDKQGWIYKSSNSGNSWTAANTKPSNLEAKDLHFSNLLDGWIIGGGSIGNVLFHTTDGGDSWTAATGFGGAYIALDVEGSNIWAQNVGGRYYRSTDNGNTWIMEELPGFPFQISDIEFFDENTGYAVGWGGYAARSNNGGITWDVLPTPNEDDKFTDIYLSGVNEIWLSTGDDVVYYSATGGLSWSILEIGSTGFGSFNSIVVSPDGEAWTVGYQGYIEYFVGPPPPPANQPPVASFNFAATGLTVNFTDSSFDPDGFIVSWLWNFGDGTTSTEQHPIHTYDTANTYIVSLTVTDNDGATGTTGRIVVVQPLPGGTFGDFTEVTPLDSFFITPQNEDFWVVTTAPADYDGDGDLDIAVLGFHVVYNQSAENKLILLKNNGAASPTEWDFSYIDVPLDDLATGASDIVWGDLDNDGDLDLVVGTNGKTVIYRNDNGTLVLTDTELPGYWEDNGQADFDLRSITLADFDNDGDLDILLPSVFEFGTFTYRTALLRNDSLDASGSWVFTDIEAGFAPTTHAQSQWADYDNDQDLDLLLVNISPLTNDGFIRIYRNDGNGVFVGEDILGSLTVQHGEAQWGDYDNDGDLDILIAGNIKEIDGTYKTVLRIYRNDDGIYTPFEVIPSISGEGWIDLTAATWADYDSDGNMDILLAGTYNSGSQIEGRARIYINDGNGNFTFTGNELPAPRSMGSRGGTFSWFDIDGDGDLDYFIAGPYFVPGGNGLLEAQMHLYRNDVANLNEAPSIPTNLQSAVQGENTVNLSWTPSSDDHTPAPAITYDIVVVRNGRHTPTKPADITARLPEPGNISAVTEWVITGLEDGDYEWRLRAVDAAYVGSLYATGEFTIGTLTADEKTDELPAEFNVEQNYPNPFNPVTTIRYSIPKEVLVKLKVYNSLGEEAATLIDEVKQPGFYQITFDATNLSSGVYFYRLHAGEFFLVKKMIIAK
jgi:photosystem II stability/assembly factor-like uncharacterized protein/PKD repeat protein